MSFGVRYGDCTSFSDGNLVEFDTREEAEAFHKGLSIADRYSHEALFIDEVEEI